MVLNTLDHAGILKKNVFEQYRVWKMFAMIQVFINFFFFQSLILTSFLLYIEKIYFSIGRMKLSVQRTAVWYEDNFIIF